MMEEFHKGGGCVGQAGEGHSRGPGPPPGWGLSVYITGCILTPLYYISGSAPHKSLGCLRLGAPEEQAALI